MSTLMGDQQPPMGLSLIELLLGISVFLVALGFAAPSLGRLSTALRLRQASLELAANLEDCRAHALAEGRRYRFRVLDSGTFAVGTSTQSERVGSLPHGTVFVTAGSAGEIWFSPSGGAENATFVLGLAGAERRIVLNQRGKVTHG